ncbi:MAG: Eco57I restriction-modification methylase domain-containing protein [Candidatus Heimdallarchaeota archaeon]|nr:Eco57I restriction-modification methylase domain-containing protein [Candidatus Heimdallarchaeota archaeon]
MDMAKLKENYKKQADLNRSFMILFNKSIIKLEKAETDSNVKNQLLQSIYKRFIESSKVNHADVVELLTIQTLPEFDDIISDKFEFSLSETHMKGSTINPGILQIINEYIITKEERGEAGIYYTSTVEVRFMCQLGLYRYCQQHEFASDKLQALIFQGINLLSAKENEKLTSLICNLKILDPACGSGVFLIQMAILLHELLQMISELTNIDIKNKIMFSILHAMDIKSWALETTKFRLLFWIMDSDDPDAILSIRNHNKINLYLVDFLQHQLSEFGFNIIIGNPPYIRAENISPPGDNVNSLQRDSYKKIIRSRLEQLVDGYEHDNKQDYYVYFIYLALVQLKPKGTLTFITSDSWMNMTTGFKLQKYILGSYSLTDCINNLYKRSFSAQVNTSIVSINKGLSGITRFLTLTTDNFILTDPNLARNYLDSPGDYHSKRYSIRLKNQSLLYTSEGFDVLIEEESHNTLFLGNKIGNIMFKTPQIIQEILEQTKGSNKLIKLHEIKGLKVIYALKTGFTKFFYPSMKIIQQFGLPSSHLVDSIKSPKEIPGLISSDREKVKKLYVIPLQGNLNAKDKTYINFAETDSKFNNHNPPHTRPSLHWNNTRPWYSLPLKQPASIIIPRFHFSRFKAIVNDDELQASDAFYGIEIDGFSKNQHQALCAILNSNFIGIIAELLGRSEGGGVLQTLQWELERFLILDVHYLENTVVNRLASLFNKLHLALLNQTDDSGIRLSIDTILLEELGIQNCIQVSTQLQQAYLKLVSLRIGSGKGR